MTTCLNTVDTSCLCLMSVPLEKSYIGRLQTAFIKATHLLGCYLLATSYTRTNIRHKTFPRICSSLKFQQISSDFMYALVLF